MMRATTRFGRAEHRYATRQVNAGAACRDVALGVADASQPWRAGLQPSSVALLSHHNGRVFALPQGLVTEC